MQLKSTGAEQNNNDVIELGVLLAILSARRWLIILITAIVFGCVTFFVAQLPSVYRASSTLMIKNAMSANPLQSLLPGAGGGAEELDTQLKLLTSTQFIQGVINQLPDDVQLGAANDERRDDVLVLLRGLSVQVIPKTSLVQIEYTGENPQFAADIVNRIAAQFINFQSGMLKQHSRQTSDWIQQRISEVRDKLTQSEQALQDFRAQRNIIDVSSDIELNKQELAQLMAERRQQSRQIEELAILLGKIEKAAADFDALSAIQEVAAVPVIATLQQQLSMQQAEFAQLKLSYLEKHPRYIAANRKIEVTTAQLQRELDKLSQNLRIRHRDVTRLLAETEQKADEATLQLEKLVAVAQSHKKLEAEIQANLHLLTTLSDKAKEAELMKDLRHGDNIVVVDPALVPLKPVGPKRLLLSVAALVAGLISSIFLVLCLHFFSDVTSRYRHVAARLGYRLLGVVPQIRIKGINKNLPVIQQSGKQYVLYQEYIRSLRTSILLDKQLGQQKLLAITSISPSEGKSSICLQLAKSFSELERVIIIDADLRFPALAEALGENPVRPGLTNLLAKTHTFEQCVFFSKELNADVLPSGIRPMNPLLFLSMPRFDAVLRVLAQKYDRVIIECPPILSVSDAMVVAKCVGQLELVVDVKKTPLVDFAAKMDLLAQSGVKIGGIILNRVKNDTSNYYATSATRAKQPSVFSQLLQQNLKKAS